MFAHTALAALGPAAAALIFAGAAQLPAPLSVPVPAPVAEEPVVHPAIASVPNGYDPDFAALNGLAVHDMLGHEAEIPKANCQPHAAISTMLARDYIEAPQVAAMTEGGLGLELWASDGGGTWTALHRGSDGISCVVASGLDWGPDVDAQALLERAAEASVVLY